MPSQNLTLRMRTRDALRTAREVDRVGRSVEDLHHHMLRANFVVRAFSRAWKILQTRMAMAVIAGTALTAIFGPPLLVAIGLVTSALVTMGAVALPVMALIQGAMHIFERTAGTAGTAASELSDVLEALKRSARIAIAPGAAVLMRGLSDAIVILLPLLESLRGPLTAFAEFLAGGLRAAAQSMASLGPQIEQFLAAAGPLLERLGAQVGPLIVAFLDLAIAGMPFFEWLIQALIDTLHWLAGASRWMTEFVRTALFAEIISTIWTVLSNAGRWLWSVLSSLVGIAFQLWDELQPLAALVGGLLLVGFRALREVLEFVNEEFSTLWTIAGPLLAGMAARFVALRIAVTAYAIVAGIAAFATGGWVAAFWRLNAAMYANPIFWIIGLIVGLAYAIYLAYQRSEWFRNAINDVWNALKTAWRWVVDNWRALPLAPPFRALLWIVEQLVRRFSELKSLIQDVRAALPSDAAGLGLFGGLFGGVGIAGQLLGRRQRGGPITRSGVYEVGERGRERVWLPAGAMVEPHGGFQSGPIVVEATLVMPDGEVLGRHTLRAAKKRQAAR